MWEARAQYGLYELDTEEPQWDKTLKWSLHCICCNQYELIVLHIYVVRIIEADDDIEPHHGPVTWLSNPVLVSKADGSMRVTVDLRNLNKALQDTNLPIPRVDDIMLMFTGKSIFSGLDLKTAFHQHELSEDS